MTDEAQRAEHPLAPYDPHAVGAVCDFLLAQQRLVTAPGLSAEEFERVGEAILNMAAVESGLSGPRVFTVDEEPPFGERIELVSAGGDRLVWDGKRYYWAADGPDLQMRDCWPPEVETGPWTELAGAADPLAAALKLTAELRPVEPPAPIRLTQQQMAAIPRTATEGPTPAWAVYTGTPIETVTEVTESIPWIEGWVCCPVCGTPAKGHPGESGCTAVIIAHGQHVQAVRPLMTEAGRRALAVYDPPKYTWLT